MDDVTLAVLGEIEAGAHALTVRAAVQADPASPVAVVLPAMGVPAKYYRPFVRDLHERGLTVVTFDFRGHGDAMPRAERGVRFGYKSLVGDVAAVVELIEAEFPSAPRFLLGHSLGGQIAMLCAAEFPGRVDGVALLASGSVWFRSFEGAQAWRNLLGTQFVAAVSSVLGYWPGRRFGFGGQQPAHLMRDWARQGRTGRYRLRGTRTDYEAALRELRLSVLTVSVEGDHLAPESSVNHLSGKAGHCRRTHLHYTCKHAGTDKLGHFSWVRAGGELSRWIADWITASRTAGAERS